jgi:hypothetical protein
LQKARERLHFIIMRKLFLILTVLAAPLYFEGCLCEPEPRTDHPAGKTLVIYWGKNRDTKRVAYRIAHHAGAALFDIAGKERLPNLLNFDNFFIGAPLVEQAIPAPVGAFLAETDFIDGYAALFLTSRGEGETEGASLAPLVTGARLMGERGFRNVNRLNTQALEEAAGPWAESVLLELAPRHAAGLRAEYVMKAFALAYPERITETAFHNGDWTVRMDETWYYYADGRMIPESELGNLDAWMSQQVYRYSPEPSHKIAETGPLGKGLEVSRRFQFSSNRGGRGPGNSNTKRYPFYEELLGTRSRNEAFRQQQSVTLFGHTVTVHTALVEPLARVERRILTEAAADDEVSTWLKSVYSITGWNWRNIAGSERLSYHSYGIAVDLQMRPQAGMETYWRWTAEKGMDWRSVPREKRLEPPGVVVGIFEENGFLWGGKWPWYDTMHFEYRPEILLLSR